MSAPSGPENLHRLEEELPRIVEAERLRAIRSAILCVPAFNKEKELAEILPSLLPKFRKVIVCDDGSLDETAAVSRKAGAVVMRHEERLGKTRTLADLTDRAAQETPEVVVILEPEEKSDLASISELMAPILRNEADIATLVRGTVKPRPNSGEFVALNSKALAAREKENFYDSVIGGNVQGVAAAYNLRFKIVTPRPRLYAPATAALPEEPRPKHERLARAEKAALIQRPFIYIGLTGIELTAAGLGLLVLALYRAGASGAPDLDFAIAGGVILLVGVLLFVLYMIIFALQTMFKEPEVDSRGKEPPTIGPGI